MTVIVYVEPEMRQTRALTDIARCEQALALLAADIEHCESLTQVERFVCQRHSADLIQGVWFFVEQLQPVHQVFIGRLLSLLSVPVVLNAMRWRDDVLGDLLLCGRVTFVPEELSAKRVSALWHLAKLRENVASNQQTRQRVLWAENQGLKTIAKAKIKLQAQGLSERDAHQCLQRRAMQRGCTIETVAAEVIAI